MWSTFLAAFTFFMQTATDAIIYKKLVDSIFLKEQIIFSSDYNITKILVPAEGDRYMEIDASEIPNIFFTVSDSRLDGGSCIYVLQGLAAYEILEGGRDTTSDYSVDKSIYFGTKQGIYEYVPESLSAKKYGTINDDIIQIQKANGTDVFYILTDIHRIFKISNQGTTKSLVHEIICATQFVLDTNNNIYYVDCHDNLPHIVKNDNTVERLTASVMEDFKEIQLIRPAFIMDKCIPFFADGELYILHSNGTSEKKEFFLKENPSAISVDATLYFVAALNGKIYEFNVMEVLVTSMFGVNSEWPRDVSKIAMSLIESGKM